MGRYSIPKAEEFAKMLSGLIDKNVGSEIDRPLTWDDNSAYAIVYYHADKKIGAGVICDFPLMAISGAALTLSPARIVQESIKSKRAEEHIYDAFKEIMNITAGIFNDCDPSHVVLGDIYQVTSSGASKEIKDLFMKPASKSACRVKVPGYGDGRITLIRPA
jgi:hypothetical protein